jgi:hypothetical protein
VRKRLVDGRSRRPSVGLGTGRLADHIGLQPSFIVTVICYAYIAGFGAAAIRRRVLVQVPAEIPPAEDPVHERLRVRLVKGSHGKTLRVVFGLIALLAMRFFQSLKI